MPSAIRCASASFNPRARTGRDIEQVREFYAIAMFQSTRPHGARLADVLDTVTSGLFQSTRPHGARLGVM